MKNRIISLFMIFAMLLICCSVAYAGIEYRRPVDNYYSEQNPPDFSWRHTDGATYDLVVATDYELSEVKYKADGLKKNIYNFTTRFEPGVYYWSYRVNGGSWQTPHCLYIPENAYEQVIDFNYDNESNMEAVITKNLPKTHPRLYVNGSTLDNLKSNEDVYDALWRTVEVNILEGVPKTPEAIGDLDDLLALEQSVKAKWFANYHGATAKASTAALLYLVSGDVRHKNYAIAIIDEVTSKDDKGNYKWDPRLLYPWYSTTDTYGGMFAENLSYAYDWLYNELSEEQRKRTVEVIEAALDRYYIYHANNGKITGSLYSSLVGSHNYLLNACVMTGLAIYEESELARKLVNFHLPIMINYTTPFSYQDGADAKGMFYGISSDILLYLYAIDDLGIVDLRNKAFVKNHDYRYLYLWESHQASVFGDGRSLAPSTFQWKLATQQIAGNSDNPYMASVNRWLLNKITGGDPYYLNGEFSSFINSEKIRYIDPKAPDALPSSKLFKDTGYASLNSDVADSDKVSMRFKSSTYGSYNHAHPDQNAFVIDAYGENLAIDSDYYYLMGNEFDVSYNRKTWVHNAITYDKGKGQAISNSNAAGDITVFSSHPEIDVIKGEAAKAYNINDSNQNENNLTKADRTVIYLRPDIFIVIDDLESFEGNKSFEFWLNTQGSITTSPADPSLATINKNDAYLFADVIYPSVSNQKYSFTQRPDGSYIPESVLTDNLLKGDEPDNRIVFRTDAVKETKIITALSVNNENVIPVNVSSEISNGVIIITAGDNTVYINNTGNKTVSISGLSFTGDAAVINGDTYTIVNGTSVKKDGIAYISSDINVTATVNKNTVSLSSRKEDAKITVYTGSVNEIHKTENEKEFALSEGEFVYGVKYVNDGDYEEMIVGKINTLTSTIHDFYNFEKRKVLSLDTNDPYV